MGSAPLGWSGGPGGRLGPRCSRCGRPGPRCSRCGCAAPVAVRAVDAQCERRGDAVVAAAVLVDQPVPRCSRCGCAAPVAVRAVDAQCEQRGDGWSLPRFSWTARYRAALVVGVLHLRACGGCTVRAARGCGGRCRVSRGQPVPRCSRCGCAAPPAARAVDAHCEQRGDAVVAAEVLVDSPDRAALVVGVLHLLQRVRWMHSASSAGTRWSLPRFWWTAGTALLLLWVCCTSLQCVRWMQGASSARVRRSLPRRTVDQPGPAEMLDCKIRRTLVKLHVRG